MRTDIVAERFLGAEKRPTGDDTFHVIAASTGERIPVDPSESIADVLDRNGYPVFLSCEQGVCGSCLTGVIAGIPDHRDVVMSRSQHEAGHAITICCSRSLTPELTLDI